MAKKPLSKQMRTPPDISIRNLWDDYVAQNNAAKQMISYREILRLSHEGYSQHQLESSSSLLTLYDPRGTDRGGIEKLISRSTKEHPARILAHLPYVQFRSCRNYPQSNLMDKALHEV